MEGALTSDGDSEEADPKEDMLDPRLRQRRLLLQLGQARQAYARAPVHFGPSLLHPAALVMAWVDEAMCI